MPEMKIYHLDDAAMTRNANAVMETLEKFMYAEGLIPEPDTISKRYVVQLVRKGMFSSFIDTLLFKGKDDDVAIFKVFKVE